MAREVEYGGKVHEFPDDATDDEIRSALQGTQQQQPVAAVQQQPQPGMMETAGQFATDALQGLKAGALSGIYHGGDLVRRGTEAVVGPEWAARLGMENKLDKPEVRALITPPESTAGQLGYGAEKMAEFFVPAGAVGKVAKAVEGATAGLRGAQALNIGARAALEGAAAGGVAGVQTGGDPQAMRDAALQTGAITAGLGTAAAVVPAVARGLEKWGQKTYGQVLNPTKEKFKYKAQEEVVPELVKRGVLGGTLEGMKSKFASRAQEWGQKLDDAYAALPKGSAVELQPVLTAMDDMIKPMYTQTSRGLVTKGEIADKAIEDMAKLKKVLVDHHEVNPATGVLEIPVDRIRELRQHFDKVASDAGAFHGKTLAEKNLASSYEHAGNAIRAELAKPFPDIARINKEYSFWKNAKDVTDATILRRVGQAKPLGRQIATAAGGVVAAGVSGLLGDSASGAMVAGAIGAKAADMLQAAITSPAWRTVSAVSKDRLAKAIAKGNRGEAEFYLQKILSAARGAQITTPASLEYSSGASATR